MVYMNSRMEYELWHDSETSCYCIGLLFVIDNNMAGARLMLSESQIRGSVDPEMMLIRYIDEMVLRIKNEYFERYNSVINIHNGYFKAFIESTLSDILKLKILRES